MGIRYCILSRDVLSGHIRKRMQDFSLQYDREWVMYGSVSIGKQLLEHYHTESIGRISTVCSERDYTNYTRESTIVSFQAGVSRRPSTAQEIGSVPLNKHHSNCVGVSESACLCSRRCGAKWASCHGDAEIHQSATVLQASISSIRAIQTTDKSGILLTFRLVRNKKSGKNGNITRCAVPVGWQIQSAKC